ncbi:MAG: MMPL family transporter [bacterium]|nr:MMPL family transporter [bacterium]MDP7074686.1 MMPL family transporter [Myxococcota bacterium]MDP7297992.1 MMPL family transporter [Myxococcota bacterium]HJO23070.1 MMPL family transporter [Myxococcota bacterium]
MPKLRKTNRIAGFVVDHAGAMATLLGLATLFFFYPLLNAALSAFGQPLPGPMVRVDTSARDLFPDHRFINAQDKFEGFFGNASPVALALIVEEGTIFEPETLAKLKRVTNALDGWGFESHTKERDALRDELEDAGIEDIGEIRKRLDLAYPPYPVNHDQTRSLLHRSTTMSTTDADGATHFEPLVEAIPTTQAEADALRDRALSYRPDLLGQLLTPDTKAALVSVQFVTDRLSNTETYRAIFDHVQGIVESEQDANHRIYVVGQPIITGWLLHHAWEMGASVLGAGVLIFVLLWAYFRRAHGVLIPLVAASVTVIWGTGFTGWMNIAFDPLVLVIPMLITARAISHTVQMAERFFEDYERLQGQFDDLEQAKRGAAKSAMAELIVPGTLGILTDVAGLLVILVTTIPQMRNLGIFGAFWVAAIVFTVELLHPVLITLLPAPRHSVHYTPRWMNRLMEALGRGATHPTGRWLIALGTVLIFASATYVVLTQSVIGESRPGTSLFWPDHPVNVSVGVLSERFGGADTLLVYADGDRRQAVEDQRVLATMESLERKLRAETGASRSFSLVNLIKAVNRSFNYGDPRFAYIPSGSFTRTWIFQVRQGAPPGTLRPLLTDDGRAASLTLFYPDHKGDTIRRAIATAERFIEENPIGVVAIRLDEDHGMPDQPVYHPDRLTDFLYYMIGPLLPVRSHSLGVRVRNNGEYEAVEIRSVAEDGVPPWLEDFREEAHYAYEDAEDNAINGRIFTWPEHLNDWGPDDVDEWWESDNLGLRAVAVGEDALVVHDLRQPDSVPTYQPTQAYSRGVQFVLAGGLMGMLAAVNEEVERSHLANISLIFAVIFVLHSVTYRSSLSGGIILLQIATATLLSLAYMALRGVGLNVHTLPVQAVGVGIGVDYAIYIVDRIRQECAAGRDVDESIRTAIRTTGMAVTFTATTIVGGILFWVFSNLRFQAEMAQLLIILMVINMLGAVTVVPAFYAILKPGGIGRRGGAG